MRAIIYLRQSLDKTGEELGVQRQEAECRRLADQRGLDVVRVITDNSVSATSGKRSGYAELIDLITNRAVDVVVVLRVDRLLRKLTELETLIELSEQTGVQIVTVEGDLQLDTSTGRLLARIIASVARAEVETKSARHRLANAQRAAAGKPQGSRRPFGYEADLVTIHEPEAAVLREMGRRVIAGYSYKDVAHWLNEQGHRTSQGNLFYPITIRNMLRKPRYAGIRDYKGTQYPASWQPIFDAETWERLQLTMRLRHEQWHHKDTPISRKYLLTGLLFCGICDMPLNGSTRRDHPGRPLRRVYNCRTVGDTSKSYGCGGVTRNADALDDFVKQAVIYRLDTPELASLLASGGNQDAALQDLLTSRQAQQLRLDGLAEDYATGLLTKPQMARANAAAQAELNRLDAEIDRLNRERTGIMLSAGQSVREAWEGSDSDEWRRQLIKLLVKKIVVNKGITKPLYYVNGKTMRFDPALIDIHWIV